MDTPFYVSIDKMIYGLREAIQECEYACYWDIDPEATEDEYEIHRIQLYEDYDILEFIVWMDTPSNRYLLLYSWFRDPLDLELHLQMVQTHPFEPYII